MQAPTNELNSPGKRNTAYFSEEEKLRVSKLFGDFRGNILKEQH